MTTAPDVAIPLAGAQLAATVVVPADAVGVVLFAHGSGSSRHSPRNRMVAGRLNDRRYATVLADLLTAEEEATDASTGALRFDMGLLGTRMTALVDWATGATATRDLPIGLFGASTGAAAALVAAAERPALVKAVVSRGGRPDLAGDALGGVRAPVLLIVGEQDRQVITLNQYAAAMLAARYEIAVVPGASHLFQEPGALAEVADRAAAWFDTHLRWHPPPRA